MNLIDFAGLLHPALAVGVVFPIIGIVVNMAWQTRQRRLQTADNGKSKIPPIVGNEHVKLGRWLTGSVVGITLIALAYSIFVKSILKNQLWSTAPFQLAFIVLLLVATIASLVFLYKAQQKLWRGVFATLTSVGVLVLGFQDGVFRRDYEWQFSHFYYGLASALLMIFSLAIIPEIYHDKSQKWRKVHTILNCVALLLFMGQAMTGSRDLLEIPLSWQAPYVDRCDYANQKCPEPAQPQ